MSAAYSSRLGRLHTIREYCRSGRGVNMVPPKRPTGRGWGNPSPARSFSAHRGSSRPVAGVGPKYQSTPKNCKEDANQSSCLWNVQFPPTGVVIPFADRIISEAAIRTPCNAHPISRISYAANAVALDSTMRQSWMYIPTRRLNRVAL